MGQKKEKAKRRAAGGNVAPTPAPSITERMKEAVKDWARIRCFDLVKKRDGLDFTVARDKLLEKYMKDYTEAKQEYRRTRLDETDEQLLERFDAKVSGAYAPIGQCQCQ